jgi:hypothetical protein
MKDDPVSFARTLTWVAKLLIPAEERTFVEFFSLPNGNAGTRAQSRLI